MDAKNPPAFPSTKFNDDDGSFVADYLGMSLRDYFAGQALAGLCANPGGPFQANGMSGWAIVNCEVEDVAGLSYKLADAMLEARSASLAMGG